MQDFQFSIRKLERGQKDSPGDLSQAGVAFLLGLLLLGAWHAWRTDTDLVNNWGRLRDDGCGGSLLRQGCICSHSYGPCGRTNACSLHMAQMLQVESDSLHALH